MYTENDLVKSLRDAAAERRRKVFYEKLRETNRSWTKKELRIMLAACKRARAANEEHVNLEFEPVLQAQLDALKRIDACTAAMPHTASLDKPKPERKLPTRTKLDA